MVLSRLATPLKRHNSYGPLSTCTHKLLKLTFLSGSVLLSVIVATNLWLECCVWRDMKSNEQGCRLKHLFQDLHKLDKVTFHFHSKKHKGRLIIPVKLPDAKMSQPTYLTDRCTVCNFGGLGFLTFYVHKKKVWNLRAKNMNIHPMKFPLDMLRRKRLKGGEGGALFPKFLKERLKLRLEFSEGWSLNPTKPTTWGYFYNNKNKDVHQYSIPCS